MNSYTNAFIKRHKVSLIACVSTRFDDYVLRLATSAGPCLDLFPCFNARTAFSLKHRWGIRALSVLGLRVLAPIRPTKQRQQQQQQPQGDTETGAHLLARSPLCGTVCRPYLLRSETRTAKENFRLLSTRGLPGTLLGHHRAKRTGFPS